MTPVDETKTSSFGTPEQLGRAVAHAPRGVETRPARDGVRAARVHDDRAHAAAAPLQVRACRGRRAPPGSGSS